MLSRVNSVAWMEEVGGGKDEALSWPRSGQDVVFVGHSRSISFSSTPNDHSWYIHSIDGVTHHSDQMKNFDDVFHYPLPSLLVSDNTFHSGVDSQVPPFPQHPIPAGNASNAVPSSGLGPLMAQMGPVDFDSEKRISESPSFGSLDFSAMDVGGFLKRPKILRPLESFPPVGAQPTLFQKRAALRKSCSFAGLPAGSDSADQCLEEKKKSDDDALDDPSIAGSELQYGSDENDAEKQGGEGGNVGRKGKQKKGLPAKNLMAERRRRKKLNDRLYMLRSVVPRISKMDRASILVDAIEYVKELLQKINDLQKEFESPPNSSVTTTSPSFHPPPPTPPPRPTFPRRAKEEQLHPSPLPSPNSSQTARVEVKSCEGGTVDIHMVCARRPGLLLSAMRALEGLGLDVHDAVISCFNGFAIDVFRAECRRNEGLGVLLPEEIKAVLVQSVRLHAAM